MEKDRQTKIIAIIALFIGVVSLTIGFGAFSARLVIQSKAAVTPNEDSFKVVLSKEPTKETTGTIKPTGDGEEATIGNTGDSIISGLKANFVNPGEKVVYEFYAANIGSLDAYLNKIEFASVAGSTENKVCTAEEGTTASLVSSACESIRITVKVGEDDKACQTSTYGAHKLDKKTGEKVVVTIEYDKNGAIADGPFNVEFGDVTINYSAADTETKNVPVCTDFNTKVVGIFDATRSTNIVDKDGNGIISTGDKVILGTEHFYVMKTDEATATVTMLAEWNLNVGKNTVEGTTGMQNSACIGFNGIDNTTYNCVIAFSSTNYWSSTASTYPRYVYNNQSNLYTHVENYVNELKKLGYSSVEGRLIQYAELVELGCDSAGGERACNSAPSWVIKTTYLTGSAYDSTKIWRVNVGGLFAGVGYSDIDPPGGRGVRPVITILASEI